MTQHGRLLSVYHDLEQGRITRRQFIERATSLGMAAPVVLFALSAAPAGAVQDQANVATAPAEGTDGQTRGAGGELKLIQWQAATLLGVHTSTGTKDTLAASLVTEPLMSYLPDATLIPTLVSEVPTVENGLLADDLSSVTYKLKENIVWSDGEPLTADDVVFTWQWIMDEANASTSSELYRPIAAVEAVDDLTVEVTFTAPTLGWYIPFTGSYTGGIYPEHVLSAGPSAHEAFIQAPVGTGPYVVESFIAGDQVIYVPNEQYRDPNKPFFAKVNLKGGGDAASAARAVLQTGDWDLAWNMQVEPDVLEQMATGESGQVVSVAGTNVEFLFLNFADPNKEVDGERAQWQTPHPFLTDLAVRQAMNLGADRATITEQFYGQGAFPTANILVGIPAYESKNTSWAFDVEEGKRILEEAGWTMQGNIRAKDGVELRLVYAASINLVRQQTQAVIKQALEEMGFQVELRQIEPSVFFDSAPGNEQNYNHFYTDMQMDTNGPSTPFPISYMAIWYSDDGQNIAQKANRWNGLNKSRYNNPEYDALYEAVQVETDPERAAEMFIQMNDILIDEVVIIPLVQRPAEKYAIANTLRDANVAGGSFEPLYWNIANWNRMS